MSAAVWFISGNVFGLVLSAVGIIVALRWPEPKRDPVRPEFYAVAGDGPILHPDSAAHGAMPHDWSGPVWNPPRLAEVPYRVAGTELY
jgi:hypothetical protein